MIFPDFDTAMDYVHNFRDEHPEIQHSNWSIYNTDDPDDETTYSVDFQASHPYSGATRLVFEPGMRSTLEEQIIGNRWLDLWLAADRLIGRSDFWDHVFIEIFTQNGDTLMLYCGS